MLAQEWQKHWEAYEAPPGMPARVGMLSKMTTFAVRVFDALRHQEAFVDELRGMVRETRRLDDGQKDALTQVIDHVAAPARTSAGPPSLPPRPGARVAAAAEGDLAPIVAAATTAIDAAVQAARAPPTQPQAPAPAARPTWMAKAKAAQARQGQAPEGRR